ncbi:MAG: hypothetical protein CRN43_09265 [Candidatus Nephrothrix sp. EaCA]|nr:MAG: hypothetical protein CRN43_09265 [Candidatus Nephrothrix sp. EaCA]
MIGMSCGVNYRFAHFHFFASKVIFFANMAQIRVASSITNCMFRKRAVSEKIAICAAHVFLGAYKHSPKICGLPDSIKHHLIAASL